MGTPCRLCPLVAVTAEFDVNTAVVADLPQSLDNGGEIHGSLAKHQMLVNAFDHVFNVHVDDSRAPAEEVLGDRSVLDAMDVPQINGKLEERVARSADRAFRTAPWYR